MATKTPHPHAEIIKAWADDDSLVLEYRSDKGSIWNTYNPIGGISPNFHPTIQFRIKKEEPKKVKMWQWICKDMKGEETPFLTNGFYSHSIEIVDGNSDFKDYEITPALWTEIEV